jgi:acyl dehydratase
MTEPEYKIPSLQERLVNVMANRGIRKFNNETVGAKLPRGSIAYIDNASGENIRRFADSIGDFNPRFRDSDYARATKYGRLIAHPMFFTMVAYPVQGHEEIMPGRPTGFHEKGARSFNSGNEWEFFSPVLEDDRLGFNGIGSIDAKIVKSRFSGEMMITTSACQYRNQRGEIVALNKSYVHHSSSDQTTKDQAKQVSFIEPYKYSSEELAKIEDDKAKEEMRGSWPRFWEDVAEGDSIGHIIVGPWNIMSFFAMAGAHGPTELGRGTGALNQGIRFPIPPGGGIYDPRINTSTLLGPHADNDLARAVGVQGGYDLGIERECLSAILFTNWMGDDGFLWKYSIQFRGFVVHGDTCWYRGKITRKYIDNDKYCVDIDHWGENQRGDRITLGKATIILPSKVGGQLRMSSIRKHNHLVALEK